jgi:hypothetical protein
MVARMDRKNNTIVQQWPLEGFAVVILISRWKKVAMASSQ